MSNPIENLSPQSPRQKKIARRPTNYNQWRDPLGMLWHLLQRSWLLILLGVLALLIIVSALILPQLPAQYADNAVAASRWFAEASDRVGIGGNIIRALGLFDVLHSTLLRFLLTLIGLTLAIHFADLLAAAVHLYRLPKQFAKPARMSLAEISSTEISSAETSREKIAHTKIENKIVSLRSPILVRRKSASASQSIDEQTAVLQAYLSQRYDQIIEADIDPKTGDLLSENGELKSGEAESEAENGEAENGESDSAATVEKRILARRHLFFSFLRPLLMLGLLISLIPVWNITVFGWELSPDPLAPGGIIRYEPNELLIRYELAQTQTATEEMLAEEMPVQESPTPNLPTQKVSTEMTLYVQIGQDEQVFPFSDSLRASLNQVEIRAEAGPPALRISVPNGDAKLAVQNQSAASASVGLVFAEPGDEGIVLIPSSIPEQAIYLRIVRGPEEVDPYFLIEVLDYDSQPIQSQTMTQAASQNLAIATGNTTLQIDSVSGLNLNARYLPTTWLFIPALLLVFAGALGYWRRPAFIFAQLFEGTNQQTISIYQSDTRSELEQI